MQTSVIVLGILGTLVVGVLPPLIFVMESGWYMVVALAFSSDRPRAAYLGSKRWIDRTAGTIVGALGLRLMFDTVRPG